MADPYRLLGVTPQSSPDEVEARYRLLLREYHPDLHLAEGPDAVARYEDLTRQLNDAMARVRDDWKRGKVGGGTASGEPRAGRASAHDGGAGPWWSVPRDDATGEPPPWWEQPADRPERDWFGNPVHHEPDEPVPCPYCGAGFTRLTAFEAHLADAHKVVRHTDRPPGADVTRRFFTALRWVPAWLVAIPTVLAFFTLPLVFFFVLATILALVLYAQGTARNVDEWWWRR